MQKEDRIIEQLSAEFPSFIGDDAAILPYKKDNGDLILATKDILVEDIHFRTRYFSPENLAQKAVHVNLSDMAAMSAMPRFLLCGIAIPNNKQLYGEKCLRSIAKVCKDANIQLIGGDTTASPDRLVVSITLLGESKSECIKLRSTAQVGDLVCIAGDLGYAHLGLLALESKLDGFSLYKERLLQPIAKIQEGLYFGSKSCVTSMMDLSDGIGIDLERLCRRSELCAIIELERLIQDKDKDFIASCAMMRIEPIKTMLEGGEDYGLLFTVDPRYYKELAEDFMGTFHYPLRHIGEITGYYDITKNDNITDERSVDKTFTLQRVKFTENGALQSLNLKVFEQF